MQLPDAEQLLIQLTESIRRDISPSTALVGIHTGGVWLAERLLQNYISRFRPARWMYHSIATTLPRSGLHPQVRP